MIEFKTVLNGGGSVGLVTHAGGDLSVVGAARVSNGLGPEEASKGEESDRKLINYLMKHRHGTPFEHNLFTFYIKTPLFVAREWQRHRIGSFNEKSGRYTEFEPEFYIPDKFRQPGLTNKQGSEFLDDKNAGDWLAKQIQNASLNAFDEYRFLLKNGLAKEMARMILPLNLYSEYYWSVNARSLMNFLNLRTSADAQWEIVQYALAIVKIFSDTMPMTYAAWVDNGRQAP